jgi:hypothetical protein
MSTNQPTNPDALSRTPCSLLPCACGGKVGSRAAVKFHPRLNLMHGITRYDVRCARCKKVATTKDGKGFQNWKAALRAWNHKANH